MSKGLLRSHGRGNFLLQDILKLDVAVNIASFVINDGAPGWGTAVIRGLPQGNILFLGAVANLFFTKEDADIVDAFDGDASIGSAPTADNSLSGSEVDIVPSTALPQAVAGVTPLARLASTDTEGGVVLDNTDGSLELNLNVLVDDADISAASSMIVEGSLHMSFIMLGDD